MNDISKVDGWSDRLMNKWMDKLHEQTHEIVDGWVYECVGGQVGVCQTKLLQSAPLLNKI